MIDELLQEVADLRAQAKALNERAQAMLDACAEEHCEFKVGDLCWYRRGRGLATVRIVMVKGETHWLHKPIEPRITGVIVKKDGTDGEKVFDLQYSWKELRKK